MLSYSKIVKVSYSVTIQNPLLWLFGLLLVGGFNLNFLYFADIPLRNLRDQVSVGEVLQYLQNRPEILAALAVLVLFITVGLLILTSWSKIMLILCSKEVLDSKPAAPEKQLRQAPKLLWPTIKITLLTSALLFAVAAGLLGAPFWLVKDPASQNLLWTVGVVFLVPLVFTISSINIFTILFIVVFKQPFGKALNLGTDFFAANWSKILGLSAVLMVIYSAVFASGVALFYLVRVLGNLTAFYGSQFGIPQFSAIMIISKGLTGIFLWGLVAGLNVFFNTALLLLFLQLTTPLDDGKNKEKEILIVPASSSV